LEAEKAIRESDCLIGTKGCLRLLLLWGNPFFIPVKPKKTDFADSLGPEEQAAVLLADDTGFTAWPKASWKKSKSDLIGNMKLSHFAVFPPCNISAPNCKYLGRRYIPPVSQAGILIS
jgi:hypothetical protein